MTQCPDHPHVLGASLGNCTHCQREAGAVTPERARQLAHEARRALPTRQVTHRHPEPDPTDRTRADALRDQIDEETRHA